MKQSDLKSGMRARRDSGRGAKRSGRCIPALDACDAIRSRAAALPSRLRYQFAPPVRSEVTECEARLAADGRAVILHIRTHYGRGFAFTLSEKQADEIAADVNAARADLKTISFLGCEAQSGIGNQSVGSVCRPPPRNTKGKASCRRSRSK